MVVGRTVVVAEIVVESAMSTGVTIYKINNKYQLTLKRQIN